MRAFTLSAALAFASAACLPHAYTFAGPVTVNFGSTGDNFMYSPMGDYNWGAWEHILVGPNLTTNGPPYRGLLHADISSLASVPNTSVQSATLTLTVSDTAKRGTLANYDVELYLLDDSNAGWVEGTGNATVVNGASSWNYLAYNATPWTGGAGVGASVGSAGLRALLGAATIVPASMAIDDKVSFHITSLDGVAALQSWANGGTNAGFFLKTSTDTGTATSDWGAVYFGSKENTTASWRPVLSVDLTTPAVGHYRFEDATSAAGSQAADFLGLNHGTYQGSVALSSDVPTSLPNSTKSISLNGSGHVDLTTLPGVGSALNKEGIEFDFWVKTDSTAKSRMFGSFNTRDNTAVTMNANTDHWTQTVVGSTSLFLRSTAGEINAYFDDSQVDLYDGDWHHVVWSINDPLDKGLGAAFDPSVLVLTVDGTPISLTYTTSGFGSAAGFTEFDNPFRIGAVGRETHVPERFVGQFDNFTISIIPEPGTGLMLLAGLAVIGFRRRGRR